MTNHARTQMNANLKMLSDRKCIEYIFLIMCIAVLRTADTASRDVQNTDKVMSKSINAPAEKNMIDVDTPRPVGPYIDKEFSKNVTALIGKTAYLNCKVKNFSNKTLLAQVSWIRHRDIHLLTVGRYTYTTDQRFRAMHDANSDEWVLQIKYPQKRDGGIYECQLSTTPHISHFIHLNVIEPSTKIIGAPDMYIESGSTINLTCIVYNSPEPPAFIFWYHNNGIINPNTSYENTKIINEMGQITKSFLLMQNAKATDSGHYQCNPSNSDSQNITVHVLNAKKQARTGFSTSDASERKSFIISIFNCALGIIFITFCSTLCQINFTD